MDEPGPRPADDPHENPTRQGAPLPPPPPAGVYTPPLAGAYDAPPPRRPHGRLLAAGIALAVVATAGGLGFALGRTHQGAGPAAGGPGTVSGHRPPAGEGSAPFGGTPFTGPGGDQGGSPFDSGTSGTPASTGQLSGQVRVVAALKYQGGVAAGTGMVLTGNGEVVTNNHVVEGATGIQVTVMSTGRTYHASVVGTDPRDDVAVLQLQHAAGLTTVTTATTGVSVGDAVTAVGDAGGSTTTFTAATGKVTATSQRITTHSVGGHQSETLRRLIEISSNVISGDSGGATYDSHGSVVGMTTAASSGSSATVGYAIPIATVLQIAHGLEHGTVNARYDYGSPAFLGLGLQGRGTTVEGVYPGTPAARAGVAGGDTITRVGSTRVTTATALKKAITSYSPGERVRITWTEPSGLTHVATVTLMAGPVA